MKNFYHSNYGVSETACFRKRNRGNNVAWFPSAAILLMLLLANFTHSSAQDLSGSTWDLGTQTPNAGYTNWGNGVISLTDTVTGSGACQGSAVHETGSGYNPTTSGAFSRCFSVFFGCPGNDQIGTAGNPYTDQNGDGMAFSFWKTSGSGTYNANNANTCGGGLGYHNALSGGDNKMITIEFDTYSSIGTDVDADYGGGGPGSGINDEVAIHFDQQSNSPIGAPTSPAAFNAGNLEDGLVHEVCISYTPGTRIMRVTIDGTVRANYDMGATYNLETYFGNNTLNYTWSAGKYGANNQQTIGPSGNNLVGQIGHVFCPGQVLPVDFIKIDAELMSSSVFVSWATATEKNNKKFIVERSSNAADWHVIGEVEGAGNSVSINDYSFIDFTPLDGVGYYRIRQEDVDGEISFSKMVSVTTGGQSVSLSPNPFEEDFTINSATSGEMNIEIHDVLGKLLYQTNTVNANGTLVVRPELPSGAYSLTIQTENFIEQRTIIKK